LRNYKITTVFWTLRLINEHSKSYASIQCYTTMNVFLFEEFESDDVLVKCQNFLYSSLIFSNKYRTEGVEHSIRSNILHDDNIVWSKNPRLLI
jgi:hypothetical protein